MKEEKEIKIVRLMIGIKCNGCHNTSKNSLCSECNELFEFVKNKRSKCPYGDDKNYCSQCKIHCYRSDNEMREKIKSVMRYAAPRMVFTHPILTISHMNQTIKGKIKARRSTTNDR